MFIASVASSRLFLTSLSLTSFTSVTPRVETIEPAHTIMMKMKNIMHTLLNVAMAFVSSASCTAGTGTSCGTCAPFKNTQRARQAGRIMNIKPTASNKYPAVFSIFQAFSCGFMNMKVASQIIKGFEKILLYC